MPEGFDYDPEAVRAFAEVFDQASAQVGEIQSTVGQTSAKAADFGDSWAHHGGDFERWMSALAEDLGNLSTHLAEVSARLSQGTDLIVQADTTGLKNLTASGGTA